MATEKTTKMVNVPFGRVLVMMIGPSGAGKSSFAYKHFWSNEVISSDHLRVELFGSIHRQDKNDEVFEEFNRRIDWRLRNNLRAVSDATNLTFKDRKETLEIAWKHHARIFYIVINRDLTDKIETGGWRNDVVFKDGKNLIERHDHKFNSGKKQIMNGDGYSDITVIDGKTSYFSIRKPVWGEVL